MLTQPECCADSCLTMASVISRNNVCECNIVMNYFSTFPPKKTARAPQNRICTYTEANLTSWRTLLVTGILIHYLVTDLNWCRPGLGQVPRLPSLYDTMAAPIGKATGAHTPVSSGLPFSYETFLSTLCHWTPSWQPDPISHARILCCGSDSTTLTKVEGHV